MGFNACIEFKKKSDKNKVITILEMLNYKKIKKDNYFYRDDDDYKSLCGNQCEFYFDNNKLQLYLHTYIFASSYDLYYINKTIKTIKKYINIKFETDEGKNKYLSHDRIVTKGEAGVYKAYFDIENDFERMKLYIQIMKNANVIKNNNELKKVLSEIGHIESLYSTMGLPYLCSVIEDYFRNIFIVLFKYMENKEKILKSLKYNSYDMEKVCEGKMPIEEAIARTMSFQNIDKIINNFSIIDHNMDLKSCLLKPYKRRKENLYNTLNRVLEQRHYFIHSKLVKYKYDLKDFEKDINLVEEAFKRVYRHIVKYYKWEDFVG